jgi:nucleotide-binding universal stress UspA family protein
MMIQAFDRLIHNILIAVDESENSRRAVSYVGKLLEGMPSFKVMLLHIINEPDEDYFADDGERKRWIAEKQETADRVLDEAMTMLVDEGFEPERIFPQVKVRYCPSIAECILHEAEATQSETIVVGRKGVSRKEEFLFGSVSNRIIHQAKDCTVWVVE